MIDFVLDVNLSLYNPLPLFFTLPCACMYASISLERLAQRAIQALLEAIELTGISSVEFTTEQFKVLNKPPKPN